jgi:hypothetical protein
VTFTQSASGRTTVGELPRTKAGPVGRATSLAEPLGPMPMAFIELAEPPRHVRPRLRRSQDYRAVSASAAAIESYTGTNSENPSAVSVVRIGHDGALTRSSPPFA